MLIAGAELFTGNTLMAGPVAAGRIGAGRAAWALAVVYCADFAGPLLLAALVFAAGVHEAGEGAVGRAALELGAAKTGQGFFATLASGVLANMLVCLAVWLAHAGNTVTEKFVGLLLPIAAFVAAGLEHSVANMYLLPYAMPRHNVVPAYRRIQRPTWLSPAFEHLDDDHPSAAARTWRAVVVLLIGSIRIGWRNDVEAFARQRESGLAGGASEQAIVPYAMETTLQNMKEEAADELVGGERHDLLPVGAVAAIVLVAEGDAGLVKRDQTTARDRDPVGVARQIGEHRFRSRERRLGISFSFGPESR